jgi:hypothetical protein
MRRRHNIGAATLLVVGLTYLFASRDKDLASSISLHKQDTQRIAPDGKLSVTGKVRESLETSGSPQSQTKSTNFVAIDNQGQSVADDALDTDLKAYDEGNSPVEESPPSKTSTASPSAVVQAELSRVEYPFQEDLNVDFPFSSLLELKDYAPHHYSPSGARTFAYSTFMATRNPSLKDPYFLAILSLIYRILWSPRSRTQRSYPFIAFVSDFVTLEQRNILAGAGAIVRELKPLEWHCDVPEFQKRWIDLFAKLNMWGETEFERIIFLDADAFPLQNIDAMFDAAPYQHPIAEKLHLDDLLPSITYTHASEPYIFAGVPQDPFNTIYPELNVGSIMFSPNAAMHQRLLQNYLKLDKYNCGMAEQAFLNWQFGLDGAYPPTLLDRMWGGMWPGQDK